MSVWRRDFAIPWRRLPEPPAPLRRVQYTLALLLGGRGRWLAALDGVLLLFAFTRALLGSLGPDQAYRLYVGLVVLPFLILALPPLAATLALERDAGAIDLALSVPSTERYFVRRVVTLVALFSVQGALLVWVIPYPRLLPRIGAMLYPLAIGALIGAIVLFWAVRLRTAGAVYVASLATALALSRWIFFDPYPKLPDPSGLTYTRPETFLGVSVSLLGWGWNLAVLTTAAAVLFLYARQRLRRPEALLR